MCLRIRPMGTSACRMYLWLEFQDRSRPWESESCRSCRAWIYEKDSILFADTVLVAVAMDNYVGLSFWDSCKSLRKHMSPNLDGPK